MRASMESTTATPRDTATSRRLHAAIMDALYRRDPDAAENAMEINRQQTLDRLKYLSGDLETKGI